MPLRLGVATGRGLLIILLLTLGDAATTVIHSAERNGKQNAPRAVRSVSEFDYQNFNGNRINANMGNDGQYVSHVVTGHSGMEWPNGSHKLIDFAAGIWLVGNLGNELRTAAAEYAVEFAPGVILPDGQPDNPHDAKYKWYKISKSDLTDPGPDYINWPVDQGAPVNPDGTPALLGDQMLWCVFNDADPTRHFNVFGTNPMGLEVQMTVWGYSTPDALRDMMFVRAVIINKSNNRYDSTFIGLWDDPDLGDPADDYVGCDTTLSLGYCWNWDNSDWVYGIPPAIGRDFFQGPIVPSPGDTANVSGRKVPGYKNLPMYAFAYYTNGAMYPRRDPDNAREVLNYMKGTYQDGSPFINPQTNQATRFVFPGDPETGTGWTELTPTVQAPGDRRFLMSSGPFTFAPGDTQEVVFGVLIAQGTEFRNSVTRLKQIDAVAQEVYDAAFNSVLLTAVDLALTHPTRRTSRIQIQLTPLGVSKTQSISIRFSPEIGEEAPFGLDLFDDGLHDNGIAGDNIWGNSITISNRKHPYRADLTLQNLGSTVSVPGILNGVRLRPFPRFINWRVVWEDGLQDRNVNPGERVFLGFDVVNDDEVHPIDGLTIHNATEGQQRIEYTESIPSGASASSEAFFLSLYGSHQNRLFYRYDVHFNGHVRSYVDSIDVLPWVPPPGWQDTLAVIPVSGPHRWLLPIIADPASLTGHTYLVTFIRHPESSDVVWGLEDRTTNTIKLENQRASNDPYFPHPVVDGIRFVMQFVKPDFADFQEVANSAGPHTPTYAAFAFNGSGFPNPPGNPNLPPFDRPAENPEGARWGIHTGSGGIAGDISYDQFFRRVLRGSNSARFVSFDWELRFTARGGKAWLAFTSGAVIDVPFELWNIGINTPDDPSDDYRLIPLIFDADGNGAFNLMANDHPISGGENDPETDWFYWYRPVDRSPGTAGFDAWESTHNDDLIESEVMARMVLVNLNGGSVSDPNFPSNVNQTMPPTGTVFRFISTKPNRPGDAMIVIGTPSSIIPFGQLSSSYALYPNYPNPFNPVTTISFRVPSKSFVSLKVFDVLGREVSTLIAEDLPAGQYSRPWDASGLATGVYYYRLQAGTFVETRKLVLLR